MGEIYMIEKKSKTEAYYLDDDHSIVGSEQATKIVANEYDENGTKVQEIWGFTNRELRNRKKNNFDGIC